MTLGVIRSLLTQARELRDFHRAVDRFDIYNQPLPDPGCAGCGAWSEPYAPWPCEPRMLADAVVAHLESHANPDLAEAIAQTIYAWRWPDDPEFEQYGPTSTSRVAQSILALLDAGVPMGGGEPA